MSLGKRLQRWWDDLLGRPRWHRDDDVTTTRPGLRATRSEPSRPGELSVASDPPRAERKLRRGAGVDPYANDAGFAKPHSWERIDHD